MKKLNELWTLPFRLELVAILNGKIKLYGSKKLNYKFLLACANSFQTKQNVSKISILLDNNKLIPCFIEPSLLKFIKYRLHTSKRSNVYGFYLPDEDKIFILMSNITSIFGRSSDEELGGLVVHEAVHRYATLKGNEFISDFKDDLIYYYKYSLSNFFKLDESKLNDKIILDYVIFLFKLFELSPVQQRTSYATYNKLSNKIELTFRDLTLLEPDKFTQKVNNYVYMSSIFYNNPNSLKGNYTNYLEDGLKFFYSAYKARLNINDVNTIVIQELVCPSEVIAIMLENRADIRTNKIFM